MIVRSIVLALAALAALLGVARAAPRGYALPDPVVQLRPGPEPGFSAAQGNCLTCHSSDYIAIQPPRKGRAFWDAEVTKMVKVYRAPISEADAAAIAAYLAEAY